jgi:hypothetical protein
MEFGHNTHTKERKSMGRGQKRSPNRIFVTATNTSTPLNGFFPRLISILADLGSIALTLGRIKL